MEDDDESSIINNPKMDNQNNTQIQKLLISIKNHPLTMLLNLILTIACTIIYI